MVHLLSLSTFWMHFEFDSFYISVNVLFLQPKDLKDHRIDMISAASVEPKLVFHSPLFIAITLGNLEFVKQLIEEGANPLDIDANGDTLLHYAASKGRLQILQYLVNDLGCNPATRGCKGVTALHYAAYYEHLHVVKYLIEDPGCLLDPAVLDDFNQSALIYACRIGNLEIIRYLVEYNKTAHMKLDDILYYDFEVDDNLLRSPLCHACNLGRLPLVKYLIEECGCDPSRTESGNPRKTPLRSAVLGDHLHIVKYLAATKRTLFPSHGTTDLTIVYHAVENRNLKMVKLLTQSLHCDLVNHSSDKILMAPLQLAAYIGELSILKYLVNSLNCDPTSGNEFYGEPIHLAARSGHLDIIKYLVEEKSCQPSALDDEGLTPLHHASSSGHLPTVKYLALQCHCDPLYDVPEFGTCLHAAAFSGRTDIIDFLVNSLKCDPNVEGTDEGSHPIDYAAQCGHLQLVKYFVEVLGCDPSRQDKGGQNNSLHVAASRGQLPVVQYLLRSKKFTADDFRYLLEVCVTHGQVRVLQYLIETAKMDKNTLNSYGRTPLDVAAKNGLLPVIQYLLQIGSKYGSPFSPLHAAAYFGYLDVVKYLITSYFKMFFSHPSRSPLFLACEAGHLDIVKYFIEVNKRNPKKYRNLLLVAKGHDNALIAAIIKGHTEIVEHLSELKYDPEFSYGERGLRPLHLASGFGHATIVKCLVEKFKCNVNSKNYYGSTPLHLAAACGHLEVVKYLVSRKHVDPFCRDLIGNIPLHGAASNDHFEVVKFLTNTFDCYTLINDKQWTALDVAVIYQCPLTALYLITVAFNSL